MPGPRSVAVLLVSHDGARWLPAVVDGVRSQTVAVDRVVAIDTGSKDGSADLLEEAFGAVRRVGGGTSYPEAVREGLDVLAADPDASEWVWLLHDDSNPDPTCLEALLAAADEDPGADLLGPKLREWPSLRRLLELGVTISATGRRETGLERGEYDQGQHDEVRTVLAVNTAGMLVRRSVLEGLGGLDAHLPIFGNDLDLGWRAAQAGHRTLVVPQAVVFHAEAAHRGVRRTPLTGRHTHYQERRAALWTLLVNAPARALPFQVLRLALGTVLRVVGFLLVRSVGQALDELAALVSVYSRPGEVRAARRARQPGRVADRETVRRLLAPWWLPYRHGLDFVGDLLSAATDQAADVAERRRAAQAEADPSSFAARRVAVEEDEEALGADTGLVARFVTNPVALLLTLVVVLGLIGARAAFGPVSGAGLSPAPDSARDWWDLHLATWHPLGAGTAVPAPGYVLPLALLGTVLLGNAAAAVSAVLVLSVPVALWGAWRLLRVVGRLVSPQGAPRWLILWGATTYALVPGVSGAWGDGRLGVVVAGALLPWLAHAALGFADPDADRRWRAAWRVGLLLALVAAFVPVAWLLAVLIGLVVVAAATVVVRSAVRDRSVWGPPATAVGIVPVLLAPWWLPAVMERAAEGLLLDAGRLPGVTATGLDLLAGRFHDLGAPTWLGLVLPVLAVAALVPRATRIPVLVCWVVALVTAASAAVLAMITLDLASVSVPAATAFPLLLVQGVLVVAATLGGQGLVLAARRAGWPAPVRAATALLAAAAAVVPLVGLGWFAAGGHGSLTDDRETGIPAYMVQSAETGAEHGILVIDGDVSTGLYYAVRRGDGVTVGEDEVLALAPEDEELSQVVRTLVSRPTGTEVEALAGHGIEYVVLPAPADPEVAGVLDATAGLVQASAENRATRAWQVDEPLDPDAVEGPRSAVRVVLLAVQGIAVLVVLVLCAPTTDRRRRS